MRFNFSKFIGKWLITFISCSYDAKNTFIFNAHEIFSAKLALKSESMFLFVINKEKGEFLLLFLLNFEYFGEDVIVQDVGSILVHQNFQIIHL